MPTSAIEAAATARSIRDGLVHPTMNHVEAGEGCDLDYVPGEARQLQVRNALSNSLGFGGHNVSVCIGQLD